MPVERILFLILRSELRKEPLSQKVRQALSPETLAGLYKLAAAHDAAHIAGQAISKLPGLEPDENIQKMKQKARQAFYRYVKMDREFGRICAFLEQLQVPFIPLKGSVLRQYYPENWMRTSCDIDIFIKEEDLPRVVNAFVEKLGYKNTKKALHDISVFSPEGIHVELHHTLIEDFVSKKQCQLLADLWKNASPSKPGSYNYQLADPVFYFYHIAHMAKHFQNGGCGIRPFMDLWLLNNVIDFDRTDRERLLEEGDLLPFAKAAEKLARIWFEDESYAFMDRMMEEYVLNGGVYGTLTNTTAFSQYKKGGRLRNLLSRIYLPYDMIKYYYPVLQKHKYLTPVFQVVRWVKLLFHGKASVLVQEANRNAGISRELLSATADLMNYLGL